MNRMVTIINNIYLYLKFASRVDLKCIYPPQHTDTNITEVMNVVNNYIVIIISQITTLYILNLHS